MKKMLGAVGCIVMVFMLLACEAAPHERSETFLSDDHDIHATRYRTNVVLGQYGEEPAVYFIEDIEALEALITRQGERYYLGETFASALENFDASYFETHVLLVAVFEEGSGSIGHTVADVTVDDEGVLRLYVERHIPAVGTTDMAAWHILVSVERGATPYQDAKLFVDVDEHDSVHMFRTDLYASHDDGEAVFAFSTREAFETYIDDAKNYYQFHHSDFFDHIERYDDAFFEFHSLVVIALEEPSGSNRHHVVDYTVFNGVLTVQIERRIPKIGTADMANWHIVIALPDEQYDYERVELDITRVHVN